MRFLKAMSKGLASMLNEFNTPESHRIGQAFEDYTRNQLFIGKYYSLERKTADFASNKKDFQKSSLDPDFLFRDRLTNRKFFVE